MTELNIFSRFIVIPVKTGIHVSKKSWILRSSRRMTERVQREKICVFMILISFAIVASLNISTSVYASDAEIACNESSCTPSTVDLFLPVEKWYPGKTVTRQMQIINTGSTAHEFGISCVNPLATGNMDSVINMIVKKAGESAILWDGTVASCTSGGEISLSLFYTFYESFEVLTVMVVYIHDFSNICS